MDKKHFKTIGTILIAGAMYLGMTLLTGSFDLLQKGELPSGLIVGVCGYGCVYAAVNHIKS
ncbi:MAG: hypothetical protein U9R34_00115 [Nanoarchaeota archaeon]|nr:hypothetical protein [Nanoarchaeota archaeon]